ncbi:hypothetical protein EFA69_03450 [Rufibacter immobilis]|uniref:Right-handed parallel beta-helix repeat-containing protein n=1 Tax=Rufibacter immobilis TaxID=1348778 RepID=A0A3M9N3L3_9BACT|nr:hypothetical protein [Rufibacter immobilis]RNI32391.1 hypothetical protein EFA69_03450 [Rufibacter immobilis]
MSASPHVSGGFLKAFWQSLALLCALGWSMGSCTPTEEEITPDAGAMLRFEADTVLFDTVFTQVGSITKRLKVYNPSKNAVRISEVRVGGLGSSAFQVYVNGMPGPQVQNLELRGRDSLLVLVKATINPTSAEQPFLVQDSLLFSTNGNQQKVKLVAYGQNATYYKHNYTTAPAETWTAAKAHVIYDSVTVPAGQTLTIEKGTQVYLHRRAKIKVQGTLLVEGEHEQRVVFQQVRQEDTYRNAPGQWQGLEFLPASQGNEIRYAEIKNAVTGIYLRAEGATVPQVMLQNSFVRNMLQNGVLSHGGNLRLQNSMVANCGEYALAGLGGGRYEIIFSTLANYANEFIRLSPSFVFDEKWQANNNVVRQAPYHLIVLNSILWGRQDEELQFGAMGQSSSRIIRHSFLKTKAYVAEFDKLGNQLNVDPLFRDGPNSDFQIIKLSPANAAGEPVAGITLDYEDKARDAAKPDAGALEVDY